VNSLVRRLHRLRHALIAVAALALSAGLAFGAQPDAASWGLSNAADQAGKTVPVEAQSDEDTETVEDTEEDTETDEDTESSEDAGENCSTDPTTLDPADLDTMRHGSIVCWAAHQTEWPEWFANHGSFVRCWAHHGKPDAISCTEDPTTVEPAAAASGKSHGNGKGNGQGKGPKGD
jgi:hypothetical protein